MPFISKIEVSSGKVIELSVDFMFDIINLLRVLHPLKLTVLCGVHAKGIIGLYFIRNEEEAAVRVNGVRHQHVLNTFLLSKIQELNIKISWFQQD